MKNKAVWITGASSGIGKSLAKKFAQNNFNVIASARRVELIEKLSSDLPDAKIIPVKNDVSKFEDVNKTYNSFAESFEIDCLINNAGTTVFKSFIDTEIDDIKRVTEVNLLGAIYTTKVVLPEMIRRQKGTIINILSVAANTIFTNSTVYSASKAGLEMFGKVLREEVRDYNIRVINIFPGATATEIWPESALERFSEKMMQPDKLADLIFQIYKSDFSLSPEEITIRPIGGDL